jgi:uncharacterized membrane protein (DUF373 family)
LGFVTAAAFFLGKRRRPAAARFGVSSVNKVNAQGEVKHDVDLPDEAWVRAASNAFLWVEHAAYVALGTLIALAALLALAASTMALWEAVTAWSAQHGILRIIDRLLFALMLVEILHTVRASMRSGGLTCEPFLVVGLIASIRRVLVITLQSSETTTQGAMPDAAQKLFVDSMMELGVLAALIIVMVVAIYILHKARARPVD